jgi:hypothetical protein
MLHACHKRSMKWDVKFLGAKHPLVYQKRRIRELLQSRTRRLGRWEPAVSSSSGGTRYRSSSTGLTARCGRRPWPAQALPPPPQPFVSGDDSATRGPRPPRLLRRRRPTAWGRGVLDLGVAVPVPGLGRRGASSSGEDIEEV